MKPHTLISEVPTRVASGGTTEKADLEIPASAFDSRQMVDGTLLFAIQDETTAAEKRATLMVGKWPRSLCD